MKILITCISIGIALMFGGGCLWLTASIIDCPTDVCKQAKDNGKYGLSMTVFSPFVIILGFILDSPTYSKNRLTKSQEGLDKK